MVRPVIGSIPMIADVQARWVCKVIAGDIQLKGEEERLHAVVEDGEMWREYFKDTSGRIGTLVEAYTYLDDISKMTGTYPDYWNMFKKSPKDFLTAYFAPYNAASYLLNDPQKRDAAMKTLERHSTGAFPSYLGLSWILTLRLLMVDTVVDTLGDIKYKIQTSA